MDIEITSFEVHEVVGELPVSSEPPDAQHHLGTQSNCVVSLDDLTDRALTQVRDRGRNNAMFDLLCQARDHGYTEQECAAAIPTIVARLHRAAPRGHRFTQDEATNTLKQVFGREPREPWVPDGAVAVPFSAIKPEPVKWVIPQRVPAGMLTIFAGDPGLGKSTITTEWAATISRGSFFLKPRTVVLVNAEDSPATTIGPRLAAAGADLDRVVHAEMRVKGQEVALTLPDHVGHLEHLVMERQAALVVFDPVNALLRSGINSWKDTDVRAALAPLAAMARRTGAAVLAVMHLTKSATAGEAIYRIGGSIGFTGQARSVVLLTRNPDDPDGERGNQRVLAHIKCNVASLAPSLRYDIETVTLPSGIATSHVVQVGESPYSGRELLDMTRKHSDGGRKIDQATDLLLDILGDGEWHPIEPIKAEAMEAGITLSTLERAKRDLRVEHNKSNAFPPVHEWRLPPDPHGSPFIKERVAGVAVSDREDTSTRHGDLDEERP
jgi:hypothetical protein